MAGALLGLFHAGQLGAEGEVFVDPHLRVEGDVFRQVAEHAAGFDRIFEKVAPVDGDLAGARRQEAGDHPDGGGFAGAVGAQDAEDFAVGNREGDVAHRREVAVAAGEASELRSCF